LLFYAIGCAVFTVVGIVMIINRKRLGERYSLQHAWPGASRTTAMLLAGSFLLMIGLIMWSGLVLYFSLETWVPGWNA
jgi:hypothetical protein